MRKQPLILVVDDSKASNLVMKAILTQEGFLVQVAYNGPDAREIAYNLKPDLIMLDIEMPGENGFETFKKLGESPATSEIPVIFISAVSNVADKVKGLELGAVDYITKPYETREVIARARLHLRLSRAHKAMLENQRNRLKEITKAQQEILIKPEDLTEASFRVIYEPKMEAGGDFYDVIPLGDDIFAYFCADVSGHDVGSSLATSALKALVHQNAGPLYEPVETLKIINSVLSSIIAEGKYLTVCYALLNRKRKVLKIVSAGHPPLIYQRKDEEPFYLECTGDVLGVFDNIVLETLEVQVNEGDRFYMYTDGIIEGNTNVKMTRNEGKEMLLNCVRASHELSLDKAVSYIILQIFPEDVIPDDDILILGVEV